MSGEQIAEAYVKLSARGAAEVRSAVTGATNSVRSFVSAAGALSGLALGGGIVVGLRAAIDEFLEAERGVKLLEAAVKSTGGAAGFTVNQIRAMAGELAQLSTFEDDAVTNAARLLTSFTSIKGDTFRDTLAAVLDLSTAMGTDLNNAAIMVGKAINDPVQGISALSRVGVSFTAQQKELIKSLVDTGQTAQAQAVILRELNVEFGGAARADLSSYSGQLKTLKKDLADLGETVGGVVVPPLMEWVRLLKEGAQVAQGKQLGGPVGKPIPPEQRGFNKEEAAVLERQFQIQKDIERFEKFAADRNKPKPKGFMDGIAEQIGARPVAEKPDPWAAVIQEKLRALREEEKKLEPIIEGIRAKRDDRVHDAGQKKIAADKAAIEKKAVDDAFARTQKLEAEDLGRRRMEAMIAATRKQEAEFEEREAGKGKLQGALKNVREQIVIAQQVQPKQQEAEPFVPHGSRMSAKGYADSLQASILQSGRKEPDQHLGEIAELQRVELKLLEQIAEGLGQFPAALAKEVDKAGRMAP